MTLNGYFTLNFHYYEQPFENLKPLSLFTSLLDQGICAEADCDPQNIWDPWKDCRTFVDATSSEP